MVIKWRKLPSTLILGAGVLNSEAGVLRCGAGVLRCDTGVLCTGVPCGRTILGLGVWGRPLRCLNSENETKY